MINITTRIGELKNHSLILSRLRQAIASQDFSFMVIFPTLHLLQAILRELLDSPGSHGFGGNRLLLFQGFQDEVCGLLGVRRLPPAPLAQELLITQCFRQLVQEEKIPYLGRVPFTRHYRRAILEGIAEWNRSGLVPEVFETWAAGKGARLEELFLLYQSYQKLLLQKGFTTDELILSQLKALPAPERKQGTVIVYGFTDLTPIQTKYLETLSPWFDLELIVDPTPAPEFQEWVTRGLGALPGLHGHSRATVEEVVQPTPANALVYLQQNLWVKPLKCPKDGCPTSDRSTGENLTYNCPTNNCPTDSCPTPSKDSSVQLVQTAGGARAVTTIARKIVDLITAHPEYQWDDFLIITPEPSSFIRVARPVFHEYGLPLAEAPALLREVPCISHWLQAITAVNGNWSWPEMEILIRQCYRGSQASLGDRVLLEIAQEYGALSGRERWLRITRSGSFQQYFTETGLDIQPLLEKVAWLARIPKDAQLQDYMTLTLDWIRDFGFSQGVYSHGPIFDTREGFRDRMADFRGAQFFQAAVMELSHLLKDLAEFGSTIPLAEFGQFLVDYLLNQESATPDEKESGLRVLPPQEIRGLNARVVFMTGLEQGVFPGIYINDWKINNQERRELKTLGIELETGVQYQLQEKLSFYWGLQAAVQRLYLVFRDQDDNAQPLNKSLFLEEVLKWLPELALSIAPSSLAPSLPESFGGCRSVPEHRQYWAYYLTATFREDDSSFEVEEQEIHRRFLGDPSYRALAFQVQQWRERLAGPATTREHAREFFTQSGSWKLLHKIYHPEYAFAITSLEDFRKCPYRFYFRHVLKVRPLLKPQLFPSALDLGDLYHQILQEFGSNYREQSLIPENHLEYERYLNGCFRSFFQEWLENAPNDPVKLILLLKAKEIQRNLANWLTSEIQQTITLSARFRFKYLELAFGVTKGDFDQGSTAQPFVCEFEEQKVNLWGKVDRVDHDANGNFLVYDYKSGKTPSISSILKLEHLQIPVYIMALEQLYFGAGRAAGGSYLGLRQPARNRNGIGRQSGLPVFPPKMKPITEEQWEEWLTAVRKILVETAKAIQAGEFGRRALLPQGTLQLRADKCFNFCEYGNLCRRQEVEEESPNED